MHTVHAPKPKKYDQENEALRDFIKTRSEESAAHLFPLLTHHAQAICFGLLGYLDEDLVSECVIRAFSNIGGFHGRSLPTTWFHKLATAVCIDAIRRKKRNLEVPWTEKAELVVDDRESLENKLFFSQILDQAKDVDRAILTHKLHGATVEEIAVAFGRTKYWVIRRWKKLTTRLQEEHGAARF